MIYSVRRSINGGHFVLLDSAGEKFYTDESAPVGTQSESYAIEAMRGTAVMRKHPYHFVVQRLHAILPAPARERFLAICKELLLAELSRTPFELSRSWANQFSSKPGVYAVFELGGLAYVGESGSLRGRMRDMMDTRNHTLRPNLGEERFGGHAGFEKATSKKKFSNAIELLLNERVVGTLAVTAIEAPFGRKEIEEYMIERHNPKFNRKKRRV